MTITEEQLQIWSQPPSQSENTRIQSVRDKIYNVIQQRFPMSDLTKRFNLGSHEYPEVYLQGSYANSTNVRLNSDIDIVVQLNNVFYYDEDLLTEIQRQQRRNLCSSTEYRFTDYRNDIFNSLTQEFGIKVKNGNKCIKIEYGEGTMTVKADVVPCFQYRKYLQSDIFAPENYIEGIQFMNIKDKTFVTNFPKLHKINSTNKNLITNGKYKSFVRILKNIRNKCIDQNILQNNVAPSYFLENLLFNCPDRYFEGSYINILSNILMYLTNTNVSSFICANGQDYLFSTFNWNISDFDKLLLALKKFII